MTDCNLSSSPSDVGAEGRGIELTGIRRESEFLKAPRISYSFSDACPTGTSGKRVVKVNGV